MRKTKAAAFLCLSLLVAAPFVSAVEIDKRLNQQAITYSSQLSGKVPPVLEQALQARETAARLLAHELRNIDNPDTYSKRHGFTLDGLKRRMNEANQHFIDQFHRTGQHFPQEPKSIATDRNTISHRYGIGGPGNPTDPGSTSGRAHSNGAIKGN